MTSKGYSDGNMVDGASGSVQPDDSAMAAAAAAAAEAAGVRGLSPLGPAMQDDLEISDDSFTKSPSPLKKNLKREMLRATSRKRMPMSRAPRSLSAGAGGGRGMPRPPSPAIEVVPQELAHQIMAPTGATGEERLDALERQQKHDHVYFQTIAKTLQNVFKVLEHQASKAKDAHQAREEHAQMGLGLRREIYAVRDKLESELRSAGGIIETKLPEVIGQAATATTALCWTISWPAEWPVCRDSSGSAAWRWKSSSNAELVAAIRCSSLGPSQ